MPAKGDGVFPTDTVKDAGKHAPMRRRPVFPVCATKMALPMVPKRRGSGMRGEGSKEERG